MMRWFYVVSTALFGIAVVGVWGSSRWAPPTSTPVTRPAEISYSLDEVGRHSRADDCWMAINGQVYDVSVYLPQHPTSLEAILPSCGSDATTAFHTKNRGRPHSARASALLQQYRIGDVLK
ncbi:MAG: cytochrome b5-like heme/steroid binding domain-containing protein [Nitrospirota bacterium]